MPLLYTKTLNTGEPSKPKELTASLDAGSSSVHLSWAPPEANSQCVIGYEITSTLTNDTISIPEMLSHTLVLPSENSTACTHTARVVAVDTAGRIGNYSEVLLTPSGKLNNSVQHYNYILS